MALRILIILIVSCLSLGSQVLVTSPSYSAAVLKPASGGGACTTQKDVEDADSTASQASFEQYFATTFQAGSSYSLCKAELFIARNPSGTADFQVEIRNNTAGEPGSTILATSDTVLAAGVPDDFEWVTFTFGTPPSLVSGTVYWIVIKRTADSLQLYWELDNDGTIVEGMVEGEPGSWSVITAVAVGMFKLYSN